VAANPTIEWTESTWNALTGCTKVSPGCKHCYAERMARRLRAMGQGRGPLFYVFLVPALSRGERVARCPDALHREAGRVRGYLGEARTSISERHDPSAVRGRGDSEEQFLAAVSSTAE